ncbi:MAG TPA: hypothetical protein VFJ58_13995 [Armatimonadota bacterium]|nr:hypothetical protein [Armatimonadota bacterium]
MGGIPVYGLWRCGPDCGAGGDLRPPRTPGNCGEGAARVRPDAGLAGAFKSGSGGGDTSWPTSALAYAYQSRKGLTRALQQEVDEGDLTEREALDVAVRLMQGNARACFDIEGTRSELRRCAAVA